MSKNYTKSQKSIVSADKVYCEYPYTKGKVHQCHIVHGECEYCEYSSAHKRMTSSEYCAHLANSVRPNTFTNEENSNKRL